MVPGTLCPWSCFQHYLGCVHGVMDQRFDMQCKTLAPAVHPSQNPGILLCSVPKYRENAKAASVQPCKEEDCSLQLPH